MKTYDIYIGDRTVSHDICLHGSGSDTFYDVRLEPHTAVVDLIVNLVNGISFDVDLGMVIGCSTVGADMEIGIAANESLVIGCGTADLSAEADILPGAISMVIGTSAQALVVRFRTLGDMDSDTLSVYDSDTLDDVDYITST